MSVGDQQQFSQPDKSSSDCVKEPSLDLLYKLSVPELVGNNYKKFGTLLLEDKTGIKVDNIEEELHGKLEAINTKILQHWLQGKGLPVTWKCLLIHSRPAATMDWLVRYRHHCSHEIDNQHNI